MKLAPVGSQGRRRLFAAVALALSFLAACGDDDTTRPDSATDTGVIGPDGGTVIGPGGARITVPAGALDREVALTAAGFTDASDLPPGAVLLPLAGVVCGPDGLTFALPVTVTFSACQPYAPGASVPLHVWNDVAGGWAATPFQAIVRSDGLTLDAAVTHFSFFGGLPGSDALAGAMDGLLCSGAPPAAVLSAFQDQFRAQVAARGDRGVWDQECQEVVGIHWDLHAESGGAGADIMELEGETGAHSLMVSYEVECNVGDGAGNALDAIVTIHYDCALPDLTVVADPAGIEPGGASTVTASLHCGGQPFPGRTVQFECFGPGQVAPDASVTNPVGQVQTMYTNDGETGAATIRAYHDACAGTDQAATLTGEATVAIGGAWQGVLQVAFQQDVGEGPLGIFQDAVTITFDFTVDQGVVAGAGTLVHAAQIWPGDDDCWVASIDAPPFPVVIAGTVSDQTVQLQFIPGGLMPLTFVIMCDPDDPSEYPYPGHGWLEGAILTMDIQPTLLLAEGDTAAGSGSQDFGEDIPIAFTWNVIINRAESGLRESRP